MSGPLRFAVAALAALMLGGCSTFSKDGGFDSAPTDIKSGVILVKVLVTC